jgi:hypothetical protein
MRLLSGALAIIAALGSLVHAIPLNPAEGLNGNWSNRLSPGVVNTNSAIGKANLILLSSVSSSFIK